MWKYAIAYVEGEVSQEAKEYGEIEAQKRFGFV